MAGARTVAVAGAGAGAGAEYYSLGMKRSGWFAILPNIFPISLYFLIRSL